jgi:single-stranded DNA-binding protein
MGFNVMIIDGNLGTDPRETFTTSGTRVGSFMLASSRHDREGNDLQPVWYSVSAFGDVADVAMKLLRKGDRVKMTCRLNPDRETGTPSVFQRKDGHWAAGYDVIADSIGFMKLPSALTEGGRDGNDNDFAY